MARILLVEDEPWIGELYRQLLVRAGHEVEWCRDGHEAIDSIDVKLPHIIVLDLFLPWGNGIGLLHELVSHTDLVHIPVVLCSNALPQDDISLRQYGIVKVIDKASSTPQQFIQIINGVIVDANF